MVDFYINPLEMNSKTCLDVAEDGDDHGRPKSAILLKGYQIWHFRQIFRQPELVNGGNCGTMGIQMSISIFSVKSRAKERTTTVEVSEPHGSELVLNNFIPR